MEKKKRDLGEHLFNEVFLFCQADRYLKMLSDLHIQLPLSKRHQEASADKMIIALLF